MALCTNLSNDTILIVISILGTANVIGICYMVANNWDRQLIYWVVVASFALISLVVAKMLETIVPSQAIEFGNNQESTTRGTMRLKPNEMGIFKNPYHYNQIPMQESRFIM